MRNIFDQYRHPENSLTHALASTLVRDRRLLGSFLRRFVGVTPPRGVLQVIQQGLPGEDTPVDEDDDQRKGRPDACVHAGERWALLIESKIRDPVRAQQLRRHLATAQRQGVDDVALLVLSVKPPRRGSEIDGVIYKSWRSLYRWLGSGAPASAWTKELMEFMEVAERKFVSKGYLKEGTLTMFQGIPFLPKDPDQRFTVVRGRQVMGLLMQELRGMKRLDSLGLDRAGEGRPALKGRGLVWDFLPLRERQPDESHTRLPHFDVFLGPYSVEAMLWIVAGKVRPPAMKNLKRMGIDGFSDVLHSVLRDMKKRRLVGEVASPRLRVVQDRGGRGKPRHSDARLDFDLRTALPAKAGGRKGQPKYQPQWVAATYDAITQRRSPLGVGVGVRFPYRHGSTSKPQIAGLIADSWLACGPLLKALLEE